MGAPPDFELREQRTAVAAQAGLQIVGGGCGAKAPRVDLGAVAEPHDVTPRQNPWADLGGVKPVQFPAQIAPGIIDSLLAPKADPRGTRASLAR